MPRADADRNLLFGINALQNDFITRDALVAAMVAWALEKHRPLGEILVERGALEPADRDALEAMIARRLAKHGGDPAASLAALSSVDGLAAALRRSVADPDVLGSIAQIPPDSRAEDPFATRAGAPFEPPPPGSRYTKVRDHARGGLGIVFVARDEELNREVALKEIQDRHAYDPHHRSKFLLEAEVTGGLEHPGIVPVYGLGSYEDGRPFYAMRFIRGDSLREAIARFHADESLKSDPGLRVLTLQKLLRRFTDVCNAIEYAHSRGVLHRDLKPDNVMVGRYGETLVVDWGLAKATGRSGGDLDATLPEATLNPASASGSDETLPGSVIGTPAYMSPEQAAGRLDLLGPASDVYGLGATLYTLLTGRVPFLGKDLAEVLRHVERGEFPRPREGSPWLDPALEAVALKAMATCPEARYRSPRALADDVDRWVAGEPVAAYPEPWTRRARRWARKHRTAVTTAAAAATVAALLLGGVAWRVRLQTQKTDAAALASLAEADRLESVAHATSSLAKWSEAVAGARRAVAQLEAGGGSAGLRLRARARVDALAAEETRRREEARAEERDRQMVAALDEARVRESDVRDGHFDAGAKHEAILAAFRSYGVDLATLPAPKAAARVRSSRIRDDLIAALDDWARDRTDQATRSRLDAIIAAADLDPARAALRAAVFRADVAALRRLVETEGSRRELGPRSRLVFRALREFDPVASLPLLEAIQRENPSDFWLGQDLALTYHRGKPPRLADAAGFYRVAVALRPESAGTRANLGSALSGLGDHAGAIAAFREAIRLKPDYAEAFSGLGAALTGSGDRAGAIAAYREAIRLNPHNASALNALGLLLSGQGDRAGAIAAFREAIRNEAEFAEARVNLGRTLAELGDDAGAVAAFREAIRIKPDLATAHTGLGNALANRGDHAGAIVAHREAILLRPDLAEAHVNLGSALLGVGDRAGAVAAFREAIRLKPGLATAHYDLGRALSDLGDRDGSIAAYRETIRLQPDYAEAHCNLGLRLRSQGSFAEALGCLERGHGIGSRRPGWRYPSARWVDESRQLVELDARLPAILKGQAAPRDADDRLALAGLCYRKGLHVSAASFYDEALADRPALGDDPAGGNRFDAACAATLAGSGRSRDDPPPDDAARARWRGKALGWLRADLAAWGRRLEAGPAEARPAIDRALAHWKEDADLAGIRDVMETAKLPEAEREALRSLWEDVEALRREAAGAN